MTHTAVARRRRALLSSTLCLAVFGGCAARAVPPSAGPAPRRPQPQAAGWSIVVSTGWVADHLTDPDLVVLHAGARIDYEAGHLPGARLVMLQDISVTGANGLRLEMPAAVQLGSVFGRLGIGDQSRVVVYAGSGGPTPAARVVLTLEYAGFAGRVALMDGGLAAWKAEHRDVTTETPAVVPATPTIQLQYELLVDAGWVRQHLNATGFATIDARPADLFSGERVIADTPRGGHIPRAVNIPAPSLVDDRGLLKPAATLRTMLEGAGAEPTSTVVAYCSIGQFASLTYVVARWLGIAVRIYDGSFQDWSRRPDLPVVVPKGDVPAKKHEQSSQVTAQ